MSADNNRREMEGETRNDWMSWMATYGRLQREWKSTFLFWDLARGGKTGLPVSAERYKSDGFLSRTPTTQSKHRHGQFQEVSHCHLRRHRRHRPRRPHWFVLLFSVVPLVDLWYRQGQGCQTPPQSGSLLQAAPFWFTPSYQSYPHDPAPRRSVRHFTWSSLQPTRPAT